jgi:hypothetical protein
MEMPTQIGGIETSKLWRFIEEQIYSLPGTTRHRQDFTILLTGSRAAGTASPTSDVDIDVVCPQSVYESVHRAARVSGLIQAEQSFFHLVPGDDYGRYFGADLGRPHFSLVSLEEVERQFRDYDDVWLWIWTNAKIIVDPMGQFRRRVDGFTGYPRDILVRKIKYHWLLAAYWEVEVYPWHSSRDEDILPASIGLLNGVNELCRFFFLVEGKPFPYTEKLMPAARTRTKLGAEFCPMLQRVVDLVVGRVEGEGGVWDRLHQACDLLVAGDRSPECQRLEEACAQAMLNVGVDRNWVEADFDNIGELLTGKLGPMP